MASKFSVDTFVSDGPNDKRLLAGVLNKIDPAHRIIHKKEPSIVWRKEIVGIVEEGYATASTVDRLMAKLVEEGNAMYVTQRAEVADRNARIRKRLDGYIADKKPILVYMSAGQRFKFEATVTIVSHNVKGENERPRELQKVQLAKKSNHIVFQMTGEEYKKHPAEFGIGDKPQGIGLGGFVLGGFYFERGPLYAMPTNFLWIDEEKGIFALVHPIVRENRNSKEVEILAPCFGDTVLKLTC